MKYTIVLRTGEQTKKISKVFTYQDGGFALAIPYHRAQKGFCTKMQIDYEKYVQYTRVIEKFEASNRVKLSLHMDGFVQFSGEDKGTIISGKDEFGNPKGLGYYTSPLTKPIMTGPTVGLTFWGLDDYMDFTAPKAGESTIEFEDSDIYDRSHPRKCNGYFLEGFVLPTWLLSKDLSENGTGFITRFFPNFRPKPATFKLRVLRTESEAYFLAFMMSRIHLEFKEPSGFMLNAPSEKKPVSSNIGHVLTAVYPDLVGSGNVKLKSLDYFKPE